MLVLLVVGNESRLSARKTKGGGSWFRSDGRCSVLHVCIDEFSVRILGGRVLARYPPPPPFFIFFIPTRGGFESACDS